MITFKEVKEMFKKSIDATDTMNQALENLIQSIYLKGYNEALAQEQRWIPCNERLPEENITVIGTTEFDDIYKAELYDDCGEKTWYADGNLVAWQPLPQPYKAESEDKK